MLLNTLIAAVFATIGLAPQQPAGVLQGSWTATAAQNRVYRGQWSGQPLPGRPNAAQGSWIVLNDANRTVLQGTWAAEKSAQGWTGQWSARIATDRQPAGTVISGTWQAGEDLKDASLADMLRRTLDQQLAGSWRSGRLAGNWWLKGMVPR
jgi:hypothetical protein